MLALVIGAPFSAAVVAGDASAAPRHAPLANVSITSKGFSPAVVVVVIGTTVRWKNNDTAPHSLKGQVISPGVLKPGAVYERTFNTSGEYPYFDGTHADSKGTVVVTAGANSPPREHGASVTYRYSANMALVVNESWTYYDSLFGTTTGTCNAQVGSGQRLVHLDVRFPKVTYERYPSADLELLYDSDVPGHFGKTTETITSMYAGDDSPIVYCNGVPYHQATQTDDCSRNFTGKAVTMSLSWSPISTENRFLASDSGPEIKPGLCQSTIDSALSLVGVGPLVLPLNVGADDGVAYDSAETNAATTSEVSALRAGRAFTVSRTIELDFTTPCCDGFNANPGGLWTRIATIRSFTGSLTIRFTPLK